MVQNRENIFEVKDTYVFYEKEKNEELKNYDTRIIKYRKNLDLLYNVLKNKADNNGFIIFSPIETRHYNDIRPDLIKRMDINSELGQIVLLIIKYKRIITGLTIKRNNVYNKYLTKKTYIKIVSLFFLNLVDEVIKGYIYTLPYNLGLIAVVWKNVDNPPVNWYLSNIKKKELIKEGKVPYNKLTNPEGEKWFIYHRPLQFFFIWSKQNLNKVDEYLNKSLKFYKVEFVKGRTNIFKKMIHYINTLDFPELLYPNNSKFISNKTQVEQEVKRKNKHNFKQNEPQPNLL